MQVIKRNIAAPSINQGQLCALSQLKMCLVSLSSGNWTSYGSHPQSPSVACFTVNVCTLRKHIVDRLVVLIDSPSLSLLQRKM